MIDDLLFADSRDAKWTGEWVKANNTNERTGDFGGFVPELAVTPVKCPDCGKERATASEECPACGATAVNPNDKRGHEEEVRNEDLEPYITLRYIARLFKVLALLMIVMFIGEVITGVLTAGAAASFLTLLAEGTRTLVLAGLMWAGGDITLLLIDAGHDLRVARILLGRINAAEHEKTKNQR